MPLNKVIKTNFPLSILRMALTRSFTQMIIPLMKYQQQSFLSSSLLVLLWYYFLILSIISTCFLHPIFSSTCFDVFSLSVLTVSLFYSLIPSTVSPPQFFHMFLTHFYCQIPFLHTGCCRLYCKLFYFLSVFKRSHRAVVRMVSILPLISSSPNLLQWTLWTIPRVLTSVGITVTFIFDSFFQILVKIQIIVYLVAFFFFHFHSMNVSF